MSRSRRNARMRAPTARRRRSQVLARFGSVWLGRVGTPQVVSGPVQMSALLVVHKALLVVHSMGGPGAGSADDAEHSGSTTSRGNVLGRCLVLAAPGPARSSCIGPGGGMTGPTVGVRSLPLRVEPITGEALDSWMEAIAARYETPFAHLLALCGVPVRAPVSTWIAALTGEQIDRIAAVSGVEPQIVAAMTFASHLRRYGELAPGHLLRDVVWIRRTGSRMCCRCLDDTDGRWQLAWRLNWSFACLRHRCLLNDTCHQCGRPQRRNMPRLMVIPQPGCCVQLRFSTTGDDLQRCMAPLAGGDVVPLDDAHVILQAQRRIDDLLAGRTTDLVLYGRAPPTPREILSDIRLIARWVMSSVRYDALAHHLPPQLAVVMDSPRRAGLVPIARAWRSANPSVPHAAVGIIVALKVFAEPSISSAVRLLRDLMAEVGSGVDTYRAPIPQDTRLSPVARAVHDAAYAWAKIQRRTLYRLERCESRTAVATVPPARRWSR